MSVCAIMMVRDEVDVIASTLQWLTGPRCEVDEILVLDNGSTDGTREILDAADVVAIDDPEIGYYQSAKMTRLAAVARDAGHSWVVPVDADEAWYAASGVSVREFLLSQGPDVQIVKADLYNHIPTALDEPNDPEPFRRIAWRFTTPGALPKVAARTHKRLTIQPGNHGATIGGKSWSYTVNGLGIRHYSWRSQEQYLRKIRNGLEAYAATDLHPSFGAHWRAFEDGTDDDIRAHFADWFFVEDPTRRADLVRDPLIP